MKTLLNGSTRAKKSFTNVHGKEDYMIKDYFRSVLMGTGVLFVLFGIATSIQYSLILLGIGVGVGSILYLLWRLL